MPVSITFILILLALLLAVVSLFIPTTPDGRGGKLLAASIILLAIAGLVAGAI